MNVASNTMRYRPSFYTGVAALLLGMLTAVSAGAQERAHTVTVSGEGIIKTTPDMAIVWFAVLSHHERPERARALNATASAAAMNAVRELGIEEQNIQLEGLQLTPRRVYDPDRRVYDQDGFEALRTVQVTVRDLDVLPDLVAAVVEEGANQINRIQYGLDDRSGIELKVLARAVQRAAEKASVMAAQVGRSIGQALQVSEQGISVPQPRMRMDATEMVAMAKDEAGNPDAFSAGDIEVKASVSVVFSLVDSQE